MLLSVRRRFLFVANTKTASTSITEALRPFAEIERGGTPARKHIGLADVLTEYDFVFRQPDLAPGHFVKFAVMREPVAWIHSWYRYRRGNRVEVPLPGDMTFAEFWALHDFSRTRANGQRNLQRARFERADGEIGLDLILRHDGLARDWPRLTRALGVEASLPLRNVSRIAGAPEGIDPGLHREMRAFYARDYEVWDSLDRLNAAGFARLEAEPARSAAP